MNITDNVEHSIKKTSLLITDELITSNNIYTI